MNSKRSKVLMAGRLAGAIGACGAGVSARAAIIDSLSVIVPKTTLNATLGAYAYDPLNDSIYVGTYGTSAGLFQVSNVDGPSSGQAVTSLVGYTQWRTFDSSGAATQGYAGGSPTIGGILLNPQAIGTTPAYSSAWVVDQAATVTSKSGSTTTNYYDQTQRVYKFNLGQSTVADASDVFTSVATRGTVLRAQGVTSTAATTTTYPDSVVRQFAWSGNGQALYFDDSSTSGGIFRVNAATGAVQQLLSAPSAINTEPAVTTANGVDTIYFEAPTTSAANGGLASITYDGTTAGPLAIRLSAATLESFLNTTSTPNLSSVTADAAGNLYFWDKTTGNLLRLTPDNKLSKVVSTAERQAAFVPSASASLNSTPSRFQARSVTYTGSGGSSFPVTQLLYMEPSSGNFIAGVDAFLPGDFNRDDSVDQSDISLFKAQLTLTGVPQTDASLLKYDLNGDGSIDYHDVKALQQFYDFKDGDANIDRSVDYADLNTLYANYGSTAAVWTQGDFTGDNAVTYADLSLLADNWDLARPTPADLESRYTGVFEADALRAFGLTGVPEPSTGLALCLVGAAALGRRRRREVAQ